MSLLIRRRRPLFFRNPPTFTQIPSRLLSAVASNSPPNPDQRSNLSARLSFVFDQTDAVESRPSEQLDALQRIRQWRESRNARIEKTPKGPDDADRGESRGQDASLIAREEGGEVAHPWPEWIELMERLGQQNYFHHLRASEDQAAGSIWVDLSRVREEMGFDFSRDLTTVRNACMKFGKDRFDILRSLSKRDIQILVGHGCPSMDPKVVFSAKLLRKYTHLDEGDVCSSCSLRNSCTRGYKRTRKEDDARTLDVMRVLLTYGFDHVNGAVENKPLMQMKSVMTVVRKLIHEVVKLSDVPIDPNLPPPVIKKPPPKVKQTPPPPKKRVGREDVEMMKGDWLCTKCDFMNFAKNTVCLQCDAKRPNRKLLPGEWECPQCDFLNYKRNMACFHCDTKRPPDEFTQNQLQPRPAGPRTRLDRAAMVQDVSNAWNFDFDDNESDGADVAAFEFADSNKIGGISDLDKPLHERASERLKVPIASERGRHVSDENERKSTSHADRMGFDDFDGEDEDAVDIHEVDRSNNSQARDISVRSFSEVEYTSGSEDSEDFGRHTNFNRGSKGYSSGSEGDERAGHPQLKSSHVAESWRTSGRRCGMSLVSDDDTDNDYDMCSDDDDDDMDAGFGSMHRKNCRQSSGRKGSSSRGRRGSDSEDGLLLDSDLDGDDSGRNKPRGHKSQSDGRANSFRKSHEFGNGKTREYRPNDRRSNPRNSSGSQDDESSYRGSQRGGYGGRRESTRFDRSSDGNRGNDYHGDRRGNNQRFNMSDVENMRCERSNQFSDAARGSRRDDKSWRERPSNFRVRSRDSRGGHDGGKRQRTRDVER